MKAILSGQTATAVCIEEGSFYSISLNSTVSWNELKEYEIPLLFRDVTDLLQIESDSRSHVLEQLEIAWAQDRGLQLILILLDCNEEPQTRLEAAECLNDLLKQIKVREYVGNHLYSSPLPSIADLNGAIHISINSSLLNTLDFLIALQGDQEEISERFSAWDALPMSLFDNPASKQEFFYAAIRYGVFRIFVTERQKKSLALIKFLSHPHFRGKNKDRKIFMKWAAPFKESATNIEYENQDNQENNDKYDRIDNRTKKCNVKGFDALQLVDKQKEAIKKALGEGKQVLALKFTEELVVNQRSNSKPEHIAKSLCDLAQFAKDLGSPELQLTFASKAIKEAPEDAWSYATLGDAYRAIYDFPKAQELYHTAGALGSVRIAMLGQAAVFKDLGQLEEAIQIFDQCIMKFPDDSVSINSRAAAFADYGKLQKALDAYNDILHEKHYDVVAMSGRAQVFRDMGFLDESFRIFNELAKDDPKDIIQHHARAEVLRELGNLEEAQIAFKDLVERFPLAAQARTGYAKILRDLGFFNEALSEYNKVISEFPLSLLGYVGVAETYRKIGKLDEALTAYDLIHNKFPRFHRNGKASVLIAMGKYPAAMEMLPLNKPATQNEWVSYHIKGMAQMRSGELKKAEEIFEWGLKENPWISQHAYFKTALASLRLQQKRFREVVPLVKGITHPSVQPIASALIMHASGELGDTSMFNLSYKSIKNTSAPVVIDLRDALDQRYRKQNNATPQDRCLFFYECDSLLLAA